MNISPISARTIPSMKSNKITNSSQQTKVDNINNNEASIEPSPLMLKYPPALIGVMNGICWGSAGYVAGKGISMLCKNNITSKAPLAMSTIVGVGTGIYSFIQAKKIQNTYKTNV